MGIDLFYHSTIGDNPERIKEVLNTAFKRSNLIIITGGLGPTSDDLTKELVAEILGLEMVLDQVSKEKIEEFFIRRGIVMPSNNLKQAYFPQGSVIVPNDHGTAPGAIVEKNGAVFIVLPGPPRENQPMFENFVKHWLNARRGDKGQHLISRVLRLFGIGESSIEEKLKDILANQSNPTIAPLYKGGELNLRITAKGKDVKEVNKLIDKVETDIRAKLNKYIFGVNEESLETVVGRLLTEHQRTVSTAESCTGGLISSKLTDVPGSSAYYLYGCVTYSNEAKMKLLGVSEKTLERFGAVSSETAKEMAMGVRRIGQSDFGVAVTGIAGPGGGSLEKPVGLVYIGLASADGCEVREHRFSGDRGLIKLLTANAALNMLRKRLIII